MTLMDFVVYAWPRAAYCRGKMSFFAKKKRFTANKNKKHLKNIGPIRHCEPPHALIFHCHSPGVAIVARRLRIDVHDNDDNNDNDYA